MPIRARYLALMEDPAELDRLLERGAARARDLAEAKLTLIKRRMGFL
jgi:tryptophanyl-tRNA synthetase